jgi:hypothetical protein
MLRRGDRVSPAEEDRTKKLILVERWTQGLGASLSLGAFLALGRDVGLAVSIGAALMILNAIVTRRLGEKIWSALHVDTAGGKARPMRAIVLINLKLIALIGAIYCVVTVLRVQAIGLLVGLSVYPLAALAVALTHVPAPTPTGAPLEDPNG